MDSDSLVVILIIVLNEVSIYRMKYQSSSTYLSTLICFPIIGNLNGSTNLYPRNGNVGVPVQWRTDTGHGIHIPGSRDSALILY